MACLVCPDASTAPTLGASAVASGKVRDPHWSRQQATGSLYIGLFSLSLSSSLSLCLFLALPLLLARSFACLLALLFTAAALCRLHGDCLMCSQSLRPRPQEMSIAEPWQLSQSARLEEEPSVVLSFLFSTFPFFPPTPPSV